MSIHVPFLQKLLSRPRQVIGRFFSYLFRVSYLSHLRSGKFYTLLANIENQRMAAILSAIHEPTFAIDLSGKIFFWNRAMEEFSGLQAKDMLGKGEYVYALAFYSVRRPILVDCLGLPLEVVQAHYPKVIRNGEILISEAETENRSDKGRLRSGKGRIVFAVASPLYNRGGDRIGSMEQIRDETELRLAFAQITKLSLAVEQSPNGTVITDRHSNIEYMNQAFLDMYGYTQEELIGQPIGMLSSGNTPKRTVDAMWTSLNQEQSWKGEYINRRKNGEERVIFSRVSPIRQADGSIQNYLAIQEDMTERKRIGQELDRHRHHLQSLVTERTAELSALKEAAEAANEAKSAFLANMSHEIRTPMNGIIGLTRIVHQSTSNPEHQRQLAQVLETSQVLLGMINDILDISKIEAHKLVLEHTDFYLEPLILRQIALIRHDVENKGLQLLVKIPPELKDALNGDPLRIGQILLNFLGNAVKFTERGSITIEASLLETGLNENQQKQFRIRFNVIDTGIGIQPDVSARLFKAFEQGDISTTRKFGGTGLGLAISRRLAEMMGGEAGVESEEGNGSCFWFTVRVNSTEARAIDKPLDAPQTTSTDYESHVRALSEKYPGLRILLAEDNEINQEVAISLFNGTGFNIDLAENGVQAVEKARVTPYDLILMDIQMPIMDGLTATKQIRSFSWHQDTPIIAMTANAFAEDRAECMAAGMNSHLGKPVSPGLLYATMESLLLRAKKSLVLPPNAALATDPAPMDATTEPAAPSVQPTPKEQDPLAFLRGLENFDPETGLSSLGGRVKPYLRMLRKFALAQDSDSVALLSALQGILTPVSRDEARRLAHSLKGVAGTLGMPLLKDKAYQLEKALKENATESVVLELGSELTHMRGLLAQQLLELLPESDS
jgi:two-component system sensor histidine kinase/response regulator